MLKKYNNEFDSKEFDMNKTGQRQQFLYMLIAVAGFVFVHNYVVNSLVSSNWSPEAAAIPAIIVAIILVGIVFGVVQMSISSVFSSKKEN